MQEGLQNGWIDQRHAQIGQQVAQLPAAQIRAALPFIVKGFRSESAQKEAFLKEAQTSEAQARVQELQQQMAMGGTPAIQDVRYTNLKAQQAQGKQLSADDATFVQGYEARKLLVPQFRVENRQGPQGTWQLAEDPKTGEPLQYNTVTGETRPATIVDEALMEKFFELVKPSTGFKMTQAQQYGRYILNGPIVGGGSSCVART